MRLAIMQPYVFPYLGYYQLVHATDRFIFYDDVHFIKRGWIHRNTVLVNGRSHRFSVPLAGASQHKLIGEVLLHPVEYPAWREKFLKTLHQHYKKAPCFEPAYALVSNVLNGEPASVASLATDSIVAVCHYLGLETDFLMSSQLSYDRALKGSNKIMALCQQQGARSYVNPIGGRELYQAEDFANRGIALQFIRPECMEYRQFALPFVASLSIIDVLMFNTVPQIQAMLPHYELTTN